MASAIHCALSLVARAQRSGRPLEAWIVGDDRRDASLLAQIGEITAWAFVECAAFRQLVKEMSDYSTIWPSSVPFSMLGLPVHFAAEWRQIAAGLEAGDG